MKFFFIVTNVWNVHSLFAAVSESLEMKKFQELC